MLQVLPGQANMVRYDVVNKTTANPITSGTVTAYLRCIDGDNAGKWWDATEEEWSETEVSAGAMTYAGGASWSIEIAAEAWLPGCSYDLYAVEAGNLNLLYTEHVFTWSAPTTGRGGPGWTYTLTDSSTGLPIAGAAVWATTDAAGVNIVAYGTTNESGQVTFYISAGTYSIWRQKAGYTFTNPDVEAVT